MVDGVEGKEYDEIEHISFSPDSKRVEFLAKRNGKWLKVIDGVESPEYDSDGFGPTFSPNSKRVAYTGQRGEKPMAVVDGIEGLPYDNVQPLVFSPDSKHVAYWAKRGEQWILVIDGAEVKAWDGFVAQPIFDSGAALHTLVIADSSVLLATVQISKGGAMVQRTLPAAAPKTAPQPAGGTAQSKTLHFSYDVHNGQFVRKVSGTVAICRAWRTHWLRSSRPPRARVLGVDGRRPFAGKRGRIRVAHPGAARPAVSVL